MKYKNLDYYLNLPWSYTTTTESYKDKTYYIIHVNELPGVCTDNEDVGQGFEEIKDAIACAIEIYMEKGVPIPIPIDRNKYKGNMLYRTDSERHWKIANMAKKRHKSISKTIDSLIDAGWRSLKLR